MQKHNCVQKCSIVINDWGFNRDSTAFENKPFQRFSAEHLLGSSLQFAHGTGPLLLCWLWMETSLHKGTYRAWQNTFKIRGLVQAVRSYLSLWHVCLFLQRCIYFLFIYLYWHADHQDRCFCCKILSDGLRARIRRNMLLKNTQKTEWKYSLILL